ncbi:hypothetical protein F2Q69_00046414 [Brassica cretica]|uniref:Ubiquitin-like protease family profile domain-containing protein n=1 Tax=Brassica cretica TaxID=69181 RepID=A0A8S9PWN3_BRACR|nr:hypothetical protein F2Q69_00046414 [Brassica cretica]
MLTPIEMKQEDVRSDLKGVLVHMLLTEDIIEELLDRKFSINVESAKGVDQKGQAFVRLLIRTDEAGEDLYRGLEDREDEAVDHMVGLVHDDYPFEHNTWTGGLKADEVKVNKGHPRPTDLSDQQESEEMDREYGHQGGGDDAVQSREGGGQPSMRQDEAHIGGQPSSSGVADMVRKAAEAYEGQLLHMFEGYMVSMKDHISNELSNVMTAVAGATASIAALDTFVKTEFASLGKESTGVDMYGGDLFSGYSPGRPSFSQAPSFPSRQTKQGTADTRGDVPRTDELAGNAATGEESAPCETAAADPESGRPAALSEGTDTGAMPLASSGVDVFVAGSHLLMEPMGWIVHPPMAQPPLSNRLVLLPRLFLSSAIVESQPQVPSDVSNTNTEPAPGSTVDAIPTDLPVLQSSIHQVPTDVSDTVGVPSTASIVETVATQLPVLPSTLHQESPPQTDISGTTLPILPTAETPSAGAMSGSCPGMFYTASNVLAHVDTTNLSQQLLPPSSSQAITLQPTSSPTIEPMLHDVEDDVGRSVATEEDEVLTKKTPSKPRKAGRAVKLKTVGPPDGFKRYSKRERRSPDRYTPAEGPQKQEPVKRVRRGPKEKEKVLASVAEPSITIKETTSFIGGFTPFLPPNPVKRAAFLQVMKDAKTQSAAKDCAFQVDTLMPLFDSSRVASEKAIDCVVAFIRKRKDGLPPSRFDFMEASFFSDLLTNFGEFKTCSAKQAFSFSPSLRKAFTDRPQWFTQVDILHIPVLIKKSHWVGVIVDLNMWAMYVVEANPGCPSEFELSLVLTAASNMFPHLIGRYCMTNHAQKRNYEPMIFSRLEMPCVVEHPAVVALMLLEMHAVGKDVNAVKFTEEQARTAGENYAIEALHLCQAVPIPSAQ